MSLLQWLKFREISSLDYQDIDAERPPDLHVVVNILGCSRSWEMWLPVLRVCVCFITDRAIAPHTAVFLSFTGSRWSVATFSNRGVFYCCYCLFVCLQMIFFFPTFTTTLPLYIYRLLCIHFTYDSFVYCMTRAAARRPRNLSWKVLGIWKRVWYCFCLLKGMLYPSTTRLWVGRV